MNPIDNHFDEMTGLLYLEGQLDEKRTREVSAHVASCVPCSGLLRVLESEGVWLREALGADEEPIPAHLVAAPQRDVTQWGWIAAFGLVVGGAYTVWSGFVEPWFTQAAQAGFTQGNLLTMLFFSGAFWKGWDAMQSFTEFLAIATVGTVAIWLFEKTMAALRGRWRRNGSVHLRTAAAHFRSGRGRSARRSELHAARWPGGKNRSHRDGFADQN